MFSLRYRTGCPPPAEVAQVLIRTAEEAEEACGAKLIEKKKTLRKEACQEALDLMR